MDWLSQRTTASPDRLALIYEEKQWSYAELNAAVAEMVLLLKAVGLSTGHHIALLMPNNDWYVILIHAIARLGGVLVPLNIRLAPTELRWQILKADCSAVICCSETELFLKEIIESQEGASKKQITRKIESKIKINPEKNQLPPIFSVDKSSAPFVEFLEVDLLEINHDFQDPSSSDDIQSIVFTSGTTGKPKGAMVTYDNHFWSATASAFRLGVHTDDIWLLCMPLYHVGGMAIIFRSCLYGTAVYLQKKFDPVDVSNAINKKKITIVSLVPTMVKRVLTVRNGEKVPEKLRCVLIGGAAIPSHIMEACKEMELPVVPTYGLTEATSQVATMILGHSNSFSGSVGRPLMFTEIKIVGTDGTNLPEGQIGEIAVKGPTVMKGYYKDDEATQKTIRNHYLFTGDLGYLDQSRNLWVVQRRTDLIVSGGENIYPVEVETVLLDHPRVLEACVVGIPHPEWGEQVWAVLVVDGIVDSEDLIGFCKDKLAGYKIPRKFMFVDNLPQTSSGKIQRGVVKKMVEDTRS